MEGFVYITTNLVNGKQYIGSHNGKKSDYMGSGYLIMKALKKYGPDNFKREILVETSSIKKARNLEGEYIRKHNTIQPNGYNISPTGGLGDYGCHSESTKIKIGNSNKGKKRSKKTKELMSKKAIGRKNNQKYLLDEEKNVILYMHLMYDVGISKIAERLNISRGRIHRFLLEKNFYKGRIYPEYTKNKLSNERSGTKRSKEINKKISESLKGSIPWNKLSQEKEIIIKNLIKSGYSAKYIANEADIGVGIVYRIKNKTK